MKNLLILFTIFFLFFVSNIFSETFEITSLPYNSFSHSEDVWDTLVLSGNLYATDDGISMSDDSFVVVNLGIDTIFFGTSGNSNCTAISFGYCNNIEVIGGYIIHTPGDADTVDGTQYNYCITMGRCQNMLINSVNMIIDGGMGSCIDASGSASPWSYNIEIKNCTTLSRQDWFDSRCDIEQSAIKCHTYPGGMAMGNYNYYIHHNVIDSAVHTGINGWGKCWIDSNIVLVDAHNDKYSYPSGATCYGADNAYGIGLSPEDGLDCRIVGNTIRSGTEYEGGRGIYVDNVSASASAPVNISYNDVVVHNGQSDYYNNDGEVFAMRARYVFENVNIHHNTFEIVIDTNQSTTAIGASGIAMYVSPDAGSSDLSIYNNVAKVTVGSGGFASGTNANYNYAFAIAAEEDATVNNFTSYNNYFQSPVKPFSFCVGYTSTPCDGWISIGDTLDWITPHYIDQYSQSGIVSVGYYAESAMNNIVRDAIFISGSSDDVNNGSNTEGITRSIFWQRTLIVTITDTLGNLLEDAIVNVVNSYGDTVLTDTTKADGTVTNIVNYDFDMWTGGSSTHVDSTYSDFIIYVEKDGIDTSKTFSITDDSEFPVCSLSVASEPFSETLNKLVKFKR